MLLLPISPHASVPCLCDFAFVLDPDIYSWPEAPPWPQCTLPRPSHPASGLDYLLSWRAALFPPAARWSLVSIVSTLSESWISLLLDNMHDLYLELVVAMHHQLFSHGSSTSMPAHGGTAIYKATIGVYILSWSCSGRCPVCLDSLLFTFFFFLVSWSPIGLFNSKAILSQNPVLWPSFGLAV